MRKEQYQRYDKITKSRPVNKRRPLEDYYPSVVFVKSESEVLGKDPDTGLETIVSVRVTYAPTNTSAGLGVVIEGLGINDNYGEILNYVEFSKGAETYVDGYK